MGGTHRLELVGVAGDPDSAVHALDPRAKVVGLFEGGASWELGFLTVSEAGLTTFGEVAAKATIGTLAAVLLAATTSFPAVLRGLEAPRVPRLLVLIASLMHRYLFVLADELLRMRASARARCYRPRNALRAGALGRITGAFLLRAHARGERVHRAMLARGYSGTMPPGARLRLARADVVFVACIAGPLLALRVWIVVAL